MKEIEFRFYAHHRHKMYYDLTIGCGLGNENLAGLNKAINDILKNGRGIKHEAHVKITIMQYTGLKDKMGEKIYEGDVVENFYREKSIYGSRPATEKIVVSIPEIYRNTNLYFQDSIWVYGTIIGNIYENPELLEKK